MRVLVTGASGFVGMNLSRALQGHELIRLVLHQPANALRERIIVADLRHGLPTSQLPDRIDAVVHLAQPFSVDPLERERDERAVNVNATDALLRYAIGAGAHHFLFASTGNVYARSTSAHHEEDPLDRQSADPYTRFKIAGEDVVAGYAGQLITVLARLFVPYGPGQSLRRMIPALAERIRSGTPVILTNGGQPATNPIFIDDVASQLAALLTSERSVVVNVAGNEVRTIRELSLELAELLGRQVTFVSRESPERFNLVGDATRLTRTTGIDPTIGLAEGLRRLAEQMSGGAAREP